MEDRRKFIRFPVQLDARYTEINSVEWKNCSVVDISREGMGITIYSREEISRGARLRMEIFLPRNPVPVPMEGVLMWIRELKGNQQFNYIGGIRITDMTPEDKWMLMDYAYEGWQRTEGKLSSNNNNDQ